MIIDKSVMKEFQKHAIKFMDLVKFGDPMDETVNFGTMARQDIYEKVQAQVEEAKNIGDQMVFQKIHDNASGLYFPPTIMQSDNVDSVLRNDEVFGPVLVLIPADDEEHAVEIANSSQFGLG
mmetsp:Transcript_41106/g.47377  ORF Transcript_41106/g.47377 Transcript_41106/m.47377 type:complete len:122 (+) Transcript_41106:497-862(+)